MSSWRSGPEGDLSRASGASGVFRAASPWIGLVGVALLIVASYRLERHVFPAALVALGPGLLIWAAIAWLAPPAPDKLGDLDPPAGRVRKIPLVLSLAAAAMCAWKMPTNEFRLPGLLFWVGSVAAWLWAWWPSPAGRQRPAPSGGSVWAPRVALAGILLVGIFFSFYRLERAPANPVSDHVEEMFDMLDLLNGKHLIFFLRNLGIAPFHYYWTCVLVAGLKLPFHYLTVKIATSAFGLLAILAIYLAGRELGGMWLGLAAAAFLAWGKWPFSLARQGMEYVYAIPATALVIWALLRYMRRGDRVSALAAGIGAGAGLYTYPSFRVVPLLVPLALAAALLDRRRRASRWRLAGHGFLVAATAALVFLPLGKFALADKFRSYFWSRSITRLTEVEKSIPGDRLRIFAGNLWNMLRAFHWRGASTWTLLLRDDPFLDVVLGGLLLSGAVLLLGYAIRGSWRWAWLLPAFVLLTLPSTLSLAYPYENPSVNRAGPAIPLVFLVTALPMAFLCRSFAQRRGAQRIAGFVLLAGLCAFSLEQNYQVYFVKFADSYNREVAHSMQMAEVLSQYHAKGIPYSNAYLLDIPGFVDGRNIAFQIDDLDWASTHILYEHQLPTGLSGGPLVFLYHQSDRERLELLRRLYPGSGHIVRQSHPDRDFGVYVATAAAAADGGAAPLPVPATSPGFVREQVSIEGESVATEHSRFDQGVIPDLFDGDKGTLVRTENATTALLDFTFASPRTLSGVEVTTAAMDVGLKVSLYSPDRAEPAIFSKDFRNLPADPTVGLDFDGDKKVKRVRLEITNLNGGDGHIHVREIRWKKRQ